MMSLDWLMERLTMTGRELIVPQCEQPAPVSRPSLSQATNGIDDGCIFYYYNLVGFQSRVVVLLDP